ncbi:MAG: hypothetical protein R3F35_20270 [Myxococcota bacterium]
MFKRSGKADGLEYAYRELQRLNNAALARVVGANEHVDIANVEGGISDAFESLYAHCLKLSCHQSHPVNANQN